MTQFYVSLKTTAEICSFVTAATKLPSDVDVDVVSGRYTVDAKSIMGIFSLNLNSAMKVCVYGSDQEAADFKTAVSAYIVDAPSGN